jgi:hypothetical protein
MAGDSGREFNHRVGEELRHTVVRVDGGVRTMHGKSVWSRRAAAVGAASLLLIGVAPAAHGAAPPGNDTWPGAVPLEPGQTIELDTSGATTGPSDADLNRRCGAPFINASVWFSFTPATDMVVRLDMTASDYEGGFMLFDGAPARSTFVDCGPDRISLRASAGTTYAIVAFSDTRVNGGHLVLSLTQVEAPSQETVHSDTGQLLRDGAVNVPATFRCLGSNRIVIRGQLTQRSGHDRVSATGRVVARRQCDGEWHEVMLHFENRERAFTGSHALLDVHASVCNVVGCATTDVLDAEIRLSRKAAG